MRGQASVGPHCLWAWAPGAAPPVGRPHPRPAPPPRGSPNGAVSPRPVRPGGNQGPLTSAALSTPSRASRSLSRPGPAPAASHPLGPAICRLAPGGGWESSELRRVRTPGPWEIRPATLDVTDQSALDWLLRGSERLHLPPGVAGCLLAAGGAYKSLKSCPVFLSCLPVLPSCPAFLSDRKSTRLNSSH